MIAIAFAVPVTAQQQQPTELKPLVVEGNQAGDGDAAPEADGTAPVKGYVARKTTTGSKTDILVKDVPQSVSIVGRQ
jgi:iron complex outermembrane receptor protein